jgi:hypothetical protein
VQTPVSSIEKKGLGICIREQYLHDEEEKDDDDNVDLWVNPHS